MTSYEEKIARAEEALCYKFKDKLQCLEALQTSGLALTWQGEIRKIRKNENLAVFGDAIMKAQLCKNWYRSHQPKSELLPTSSHAVEIDDWRRAMGSCGARAPKQ